MRRLKFARSHATVFCAGPVLGPAIEHINHLMRGAQTVLQVRDIHALHGGSRARRQRGGDACGVPADHPDQNAIVIGRTEYTNSVAAFMPEDGLAVGYNAAQRRVGIHNCAPRSGEPTRWFREPAARRNYGLITFVPSDDSGAHRTVIFSAINSDGAEAGARFFTSNARLEQLVAAVRKAHSSGWPQRYQVIVRTNSLDTYSLDAEFEYLRILK